MAKSANLSINAQYEVKITQVTQVNDDATFDCPPVGTAGKSFQVHMANNSFPLAPKGVGVDIKLEETEAPKRAFSVHLEVPAVGNPEFTANSSTGPAPTKSNGGDNISFSVTLPPKP